MQVPINSRRCIQCGNITTNAVYCFKCYRSSDAGKEELRLQHLLKKHRQLPDGGECRTCVHWYHRCTLGIPEGGTELAALCAAKELEGVLE